MQTHKRSLVEFIAIFLDERTLSETIAETRLGEQYLKDRSDIGEHNFDIIDSDIDSFGNTQVIIIPNGKNIIPVNIDFDEMLDLICD